MSHITKEKAIPSDRRGKPTYSLQESLMCYTDDIEGDYHVAI